MAKLTFQTSINAPREKVWEMLWSDEGYRKWTAVFSEGSYAESDWNEGSEVRFLSPEGSGLYGVISQKAAPERMTFHHLGEIKDGKKEPRDWGAALEDYQLTQANGATALYVAFDMDGDFTTYMNETFPKALAVLKEISEA